ncbi:MAG TPA: hypothetical protein EYO20_04735 [Gemmatimonadetes bacterium]|nr:hypothetical protein [Gemmatimonadota bacterium]
MKAMKAYIATSLITLGLLAADQEPLNAQGRGRGNQTPTIRQLAWVDRSGDVEGTIGPRMSSASIRPSPPMVARLRSAADRTKVKRITSGSSKA